MKNSFFLECLTAKAVDKNLKKTKRELIQRWLYCFEDILNNGVDEIDLLNFFKDYIQDDKTHLEAFQVVTKINSAFTLSINPKTVSNHLKTLQKPGKTFSQTELAVTMKCDRGELNKLLKEIELDKQSLLKKGRKGIDLEEALAIKYLLNASSNEKDRVKLFGRLIATKKLAALSEADLRLKDSELLRKVNNRTGVFDS